MGVAPRSEVCDPVGPLPRAQVHLTRAGWAVLPCRTPSASAGLWALSHFSRGGQVRPREDAVTGAGSKWYWQGLNLWPPGEELATWFLLAQSGSWFK